MLQLPHLMTFQSYNDFFLKKIQLYNQISYLQPLQDCAVTRSLFMCFTHKQQAKLVPLQQAEIMEVRL